MANFQKAKKIIFFAKTEPFKLWIANLGSESIDKVFEPEKAIKRAVNYYRKRHAMNYISV